MMKNQEESQSVNWFAINTELDTPLGGKLVQYLRRSDKVISLNRETGKQEISEVAGVETFDLISYIRINGNLRVIESQLIETTKGVKIASDIEEGDELIGRFESIKVSSVDSVLLEEPVLGVSITGVKPNDNFFAQGVLVK